MRWGEMRKRKKREDALRNAPGGESRVGANEKDIRAGRGRGREGERGREIGLLSILLSVSFLLFSYRMAYKKETKHSKTTLSITALLSKSDLPVSVILCLYLMFTFQLPSLPHLPVVSRLLIHVMLRP